MMGFTLVGGRAHRVQGRPSALFTYRGAGGIALVCQMFEARMTELSTPRESRTQNGVTFAIYQVGAATLVFWPEGSIVCVLASTLDPERVIALAVAKAQA
ncbi:MAG: hypothetical protein FJ202_00520 [Gemmatimonadetes bacterium]|nr:hypothetical protein [Gemmatimonadota bacterium]